MIELSHKRFDEVFDLQLGRTPARGVDKYWGGTNTWVSIADMGHSKYIASSKECITDAALEETSIPVVPKDVVIMSFKLSIGKVAITKQVLYTNEAIMAFIPKPETKILNDYLYYYLQGYKWDNSNNVVMGFTLNKKSISSSIIAYPSLPEQQRIVDILDREFAKIDALKANAEQTLQAAKNLFRKSMDILLSPQANWKEAKLGEICSKIGSGATPSGGKRTYQNEGINLIRSLNVHNNEFRYDDLAHINAIQASSLDNVEIHKGDVLFNITGASVARCCLVPDDVIPARVNQHVSILRPIPKTINPALLVFIMISPRQNELLMKTAENGATRQAITKRELEEWRIQYPSSTDKQQEIIVRLNELDDKCKALQENYQKTLTLCDDLKLSLLRKAFNGEL